MGINAYRIAAEWYTAWHSFYRLSRLYGCISRKSWLYLISNSILDRILHSRRRDDSIRHRNKVSRLGRDGGYRFLRHQLRLDCCSSEPSFLFHALYSLPSCFDLRFSSQCVHIVSDFYVRFYTGFLYLY